MRQTFSNDAIRRATSWAAAALVLCLSWICCLDANAQWQREGGKLLFGSFAEWCLERGFEAAVAAENEADEATSIELKAAAETDVELSLIEAFLEAKIEIDFSVKTGSPEKAPPVYEATVNSCEAEFGPRPEPVSSSPKRAAPRTPHRKNRREHNPYRARAATVWYKVDTYSTPLVLRSRPRRGDNELTKLPPLTRVEIIGRTGRYETIGGYYGEWVEVVTRDGRAGYVFGHYLTSD